MNSLGKLVLSVATMALPALSMNALVNELRISLRDGRVIVIDLTEVTRVVDGQTVTVHPVMKFSPEATNVQFVVPAKSETEAPVIHTLEVADLQAMNPIETSMSGIADVAAESDVTVKLIGENELLVSGNNEEVSAETVRVYDMTGRSMDIIASQSESGLSISLESLPAGVYVVNVSSVTVKVIKK